MKNIVIASTNAGKIREMRGLLAPLGLDVRSLKDFDIGPIAETGQTFVENALIKARAVASVSELPTIADDSGLIVPELDGAPGVYSARYAGETASDADNNQQLLSALDGQTQRDAYYYAVIVLMRHANDPAPIIGTGAWHGKILTTPRGVGGFGYDPLFQPVGETRSAAELSPEEKNQVSHRSQALKTIIDALNE